MEENKFKQRIQKILDKESEIAKEKEVLIGINPETYLGNEILKQSREIIALRSEVQEIKKMAAEIINCLNKKLD